MRLDLFGVVGEDFTPTIVRNALPSSGEVHVSINSGGGYAADGATIYNLLHAHPGKVTVEVVGIAASAASLIAMAGDSIVMASGAVMMIHDPLQVTIGNSADHAKTIEELEAYAKAYARIYSRRAGISEQTARLVMKAETWYDGPEAVAAGFATATGTAKAAAYAMYDYERYRHATQAMARVAKSHPHLVARNAEDVKASWAKVVARMSGKEVKDPSRLQHGWDSVVADFNKRNAPNLRDKPAEFSGWSKVIAEHNARRHW
ncbi:MULTISPECIES: head maturation protease, ClpP-related [unclassified Shinella]|uniref:head maturation protease, ClpP-related n=1 Tax=unclassified Shinella TaxID=2643062 RepID=UPI0006824EA2|nr:MULTISPECIES: head maturation protease, ClpP-related [unclassified Shinella]